MKTIVRFINHETPDAVFEGNIDISIQPQLGMVMLQQDKEIIGLFPIHGVAGVFHPDGASRVKIAELV